MKKSLRDTLFGFRTKKNKDIAIATRKEKTLASVNEADTTSVKPPRVNRTIGLTEARLRARNKESWTRPDSISALAGSARIPR